MSKKKYYAVRKGRTIGVFDNWAECEESVLGFSGSEYKGFKTKEGAQHYIAIPPGETIKEQLEDRDMSQKEFARRMDLSEKHVSRLLNGKVGLTHDTALKLESVLGIKAEFWNNLENRYREKLALVKSEVEWSKILNIKRNTLYLRLYNNWTTEEAFTGIKNGVKY